MDVLKKDAAAKKEREKEPEEENKPKDKGKGRAVPMEEPKEKEKEKENLMPSFRTVFDPENPTKGNIYDENDLEPRTDMDEKEHPIHPRGHFKVFTDEEEMVTLYEGYNAQEDVIMLASADPIPTPAHVPRSILRTLMASMHERQCEVSLSCRIFSPANFPASLASELDLSKNAWRLTWEQAQILEEEADARDDPVHYFQLINMELKTVIYDGDGKLIAERLCMNAVFPSFDKGLVLRIDHHRPEKTNDDDESTLCRKIDSVSLIHIS